MIATTPIDLATNVTTTETPTATFSRAMDPTTITPVTFTLKQGTTVIDGGVTLDGTTATFTPAAPLGTNLTYTATLTTGATASGGPALAANRTWSFTTERLDLRTAKTFSVLGASVNNTGPTTLSGDLGVSGTVSQFPPGIVAGAKHLADAEATQAISDLQAAYNAAAAFGSTAVLTSPLDGQTLTAGVYRSSGAVALGFTLTLDGQGNPNAVFIFQLGAALDTTANTSKVELINGARASNVFWQVSGAVTLGARSTFRGTILGNAAITVGLDTVVEGRVLTTTGLVTLATNTIRATIRDGGYGFLTGSSAFQVINCRAFARLAPDGGADLSRVGLEMADVSYPCQHPMNPIRGPGSGIVLEGYSSDGGQGKGTFLSNASNIYRVELNPDAGAPLGVEFVVDVLSSFSLEWGADPSQGVTGKMNLTMADGGTIQGTFAGSYCGTY